MSEILCFGFTIFAIAVAQFIPDIPENTFLNATEQVSFYGYPLEIHDVTTKDGYILQLHRIPHGLNNTKSHNKKVVLIVPCIFCTSGVFFIYGSDKSLPYILANLDYDVWVTNPRGSTFSRRHKFLDPDKEAALFFDFSFHETGVYDLPRVIDYILFTTGQDDLYYIGFSLGTTSFLVMGTELPSYNSKIRLAVLMAPVSYVSHIAQPFYHKLARRRKILQAAGLILGVHEILPKSEILIKFAPICADGSLFQSFCTNIVSFLCGWDNEVFNTTVLPLLVSVAPGGGSRKELMHYAQLINSGKFRKYDYGKIRNLLKYGWFSPPDYKLWNVASPVAIYHAKNDWFSAVADVDQLASELPNVVKKRLIPIDEFNHLDFLYAKDIDHILYIDIVALMSEF